MSLDTRCDKISKKFLSSVLCPNFGHDSIYFNVRERTYKKNTGSYFNLHYNISKVHQNWKGTFTRIFVNE